VEQFKPFHVLLFTIGVFALLIPVSLLVEDDSVKIGDTSMLFISTDEILTPEKEIKKDITHIVAKVDTSAIVEPARPRKKSKLVSDGKMGAPNGGELSGESATIIQFAESGRQALHAFFAKLDKAAAGEKIRILHYGDSQIEGDRMTAYIRQRLQSQFGGNGPGMIPAMNVYQTQSFRQTYSSNFKRYTAFGGARLKSRRYGSMCTAARFTPEYDSEQMVGRRTVKEAFIEIEPSPAAYERARSYNNVKLYYTSCFKPCALKVYQNGALLHEDSLITDGRYHEFPLSFPGNPGRLKYVFSSAVSPTIIGFSLEGDYGVQVDNIGMRGSSGTFFGNIDHITASKMYADLNVEMVIMQFGGNSVPFLKDSSSVRNYVRKFRGQLLTLKRLCPEATILVIGPSDMSTRNSAGFVTYKMLPVLVNEMRNAVKEIGGCYWDLYNAMGGFNSMPSWVDQGLAGRDYIHFTLKGASIASQLFFDALAAEYVRWKQGN
jgi:hypothetical protein